jgi:mono/diheme cytochrome c family protein
LTNIGEHDINHGSRPKGAGQVSKARYVKPFDAIPHFLPRLGAALAVLLALSPALGAPVDGADLYRRHCLFCHGEQGQGYLSEGAPALGGQDFLASVSDEFLSRSIARGRPGTWMAAYAQARGGPLNGAEIQALVGFIRSWQRVAAADLDSAPVLGDAGQGRRTYAEHCAECHGRRGEGHSALSLNNPEFLAAASDGQIRWAIARGRRGTAMPGYEAKLGPGGIDDLLALIRGWQP